jgi:hypothetical protein
VDICPPRIAVARRALESREDWLTNAFETCGVALGVDLET